MAQEPEEDFEDEGEGGADDESSGFLGGLLSGRKRLLLLIVVPLVLVIGAGAAAYFTGLADPLLALITGKKPVDTASADVPGKDAGKKANGEEPAGSPNGGAAPLVPVATFYELPSMTVNIDTASRQKSFLKLTVSVEIAAETDIPKIDNITPRIVDEFQVYLRGLKADDLQGAAGAYRLKEELLTRINAAVRPIQVKDVLIKEFIVQ